MCTCVSLRKLSHESSIKNNKKNLWNKFNKEWKTCAVKTMSLIKDVEKDKNTWKDMLVLELEELVFENVHTTQKFLKIQGDFQWFPQNTLSSINRWVSFNQQKILRAKTVVSWRRNSTFRLQHRNSVWAFSLPSQDCNVSSYLKLQVASLPYKFLDFQLASLNNSMRINSLSLHLSKHTHTNKYTHTSFRYLSVFLSHSSLSFDPLSFKNPAVSGCVSFTIGWFWYLIYLNLKVYLWINI